MVSFTDQIKKNLENNGFPQKKVSLPLEKLYEIAESKGENLNKVLAELETEGIKNHKTLDKIIFQSSAGIPDSDNLKKVQTPEEMYAKAQEMMKGMKPEELEKIQQEIAKMSPEDKEKLINQAKSMGLF